MIVNLYKHRGYIWRAALADVRHRYAGSSAGVLWNLLQPLALILVFTLVFTQVMVRNVEGLSTRGGYVLYLCSALLPWIAFADCLNRGTNAFVTNAMYLRKLPIPEQVFAAQSVVSTGIGLAISFSLLVVAALVLGYAPTWHWLLIPAPLAFLLALGLGVGLVLGTVNAFIRDVGQVVPVLLQIGFWSFPIVYHEDLVPVWMQELLPYNPVYPALRSVRMLFVEHAVPGPALWGGMVLWAAAANAAGYLVLRRLRPELRDVI